MKKVLVSLLLIHSLFISAQDGAVGDWIDYMPHHNVFSVAEGSNVTFGATSLGLIEFSKNESAISLLSKANGLSDVGITCLGYNELTKSFLVGYQNGKIDIITSDQIFTISDLHRKSIGGNKSLNSVFMDSVYAYIGTGFGIIKFNLERKEFTETYFITNNGDQLYVNDLTIFNDTIYAATVKGIRKAYKNDPQITFYETWETDTTLPNPQSEYSIISMYQSDLYANFPNDTAQDILYHRTSTGSWEEVVGLIGKENRSVEAYENQVLIAHESSISSYNEIWEETNRIFNYGEGTYVNSNTAILGKENTIWVGDRTFGMIQNPKPFWYEVINPQSPATFTVDEIAIRNGQINIAAGLKQNNWSNSYNNNGMLWRTPENTWGQTTKFTDSKLNGVFDLITVKINPFDQSKVFSGSIGGGLVEFTNNDVSEVYNTTNSPLQNATNIEWVIVSGLDFDNSGNLWVANSSNPSALAVLTNEKEWYNFSFGQFLTDDQTGPLLVDQQNYKWVVLPKGGKGILIFNDNGTIEDKTDDQSKILNSAIGQGGLPSSDIYSIAEDHDGEIWVGTAEGVGVFYSPTSIFAGNTNYDAQRIIVEVNGYFQYLLGTETVTAIAIDGANRKWFGTKGSGVFLMSADGTTELHHFTAENSPLLSNFIRCITINEMTGEVLFGTDNGIIAYKGTATGEEAQTIDSYAYPNPVPENYSGPIAIKGLPANSAVRITDIAGNLVFTTESEGTQVVWNGNDMNGKPVGTGIYLVFGIDGEGNNSQIAKIMFTK